MHARRTAGPARYPGRLLAAAFLSLAALLPARPDVGAQPAVPAQTQDAPPACKDAAITRIVQARLSADREIGEFRIGVATSECVVTLSGCVESKDQVKKAKELARRLVRVKVKNNLTVCLIAPKKARNPKTSVAGRGPRVRRAPPRTPPGSAVPPPG